MSVSVEQKNKAMSLADAAVRHALEGDHASVTGTCARLAREPAPLLVCASLRLASAIDSLARSLGAGLASESLLPAAGITGDPDPAAKSAADLTVAMMSGDPERCAGIYHSAETENILPGLMEAMAILVARLSAAVFTPDTAALAAEYLGGLNISGCG